MDQGKAYCGSTRADHDGNGGGALLEELKGTSEVKSVAIWDGGQGDGKDGGKNIDQSKSLINAGFQDGTIKVWDSGAPQFSQNHPSYLGLLVCVASHMLA